MPEQMFLSRRGKRTKWGEWIEGQLMVRICSKSCRYVNEREAIERSRGIREEKLRLTYSYEGKVFKNSNFSGIENHCL